MTFKTHTATKPITVWLKKHRTKSKSPRRPAICDQLILLRVCKELLHNVLVLVGRHCGYKDEFSYDIKFILSIFEQNC